MVYLNFFRLTEHTSVKSMFSHWCKKKIDNNVLLVITVCDVLFGGSLDLHQRAGAQCWHGGEGQQPLHGGHCSGDSGGSGGRSGAGLRCHETFKEEEKRWALCYVDFGQTCLYNFYGWWVQI